MSNIYSAFDNHTFQLCGFKDFNLYCEKINYVNQKEYGDGQMEGEWYWIDYKEWTIYTGAFGNYNSPGASCYTHAVQFDPDEEALKFLKACEFWEGMPEYILVEQTTEKELV